MFRTTISSTALYNEAANSYFDNITGERYRDDVTFLSTLRALAAPRMSEGERIQLFFTTSNYTARDVSNNSASRVVKAMLDMGYYESNGTFIVHSVDAREQSDNYACLELMKTTFCDVNKGFERVEKVTDFFRKTFYSLCFVNPKKKQVVLFVENLNIRKLHYLQCGIFAFMPWYFDPKVGVSADEMELIQSLRETQEDGYLECIRKISAKYDFRTVIIKKKLTGFETRFDKVELDKTKNQIDRVMRDIKSHNDTIANLFNKKRDLDIKALGLEQKIESGQGESEIMEYFLCNKKLFLIDVSDRAMTFCVKDYLTYFDEDMAKRIINNPTSYVYRPGGYDRSRYISNEDMKMLMTALFIDQSLRMKICASYEFILGERVNGISGARYPSECDDCMPNTHIDRYSCLGNNDRAINECIKNNDYIGALEQSISSCKGMNFADSAVMRIFMDRLYGVDGYTHNRCIELPDGSVVKPTDAIEWLHEQNEEKKKAEEAAKAESVAEETTVDVVAETVVEETAETVEETAEIRTEDTQERVVHVPELEEDDDGFPF